MISNLKLFLLGIVYMLCAVLLPAAAQPSCSDMYSISVGVNTTSGTTLETINCTSPSGTVAYSIDETSDGSDYFAVNSTTGLLSLANRLDVEYGPVTWEIHIVAADGVGNASATVTVKTFISTTTTTSTQPPPGYDWFDKSNNRYLFWGVMGFMALIFGTCVILCIRFHRLGTCFPKKYPQYDHMLASFNRQVTCCPIPCDFYKDKKKTEKDEKEEEHEYVDDTPWGLPLREPKPVTPKKSATPKKSSTPASKEKESTSPDLEAERPVVITPLVIGNVNLNDVGFDGMRSPGFNAPMFTSYGGKKGTSSKTLKKY